MTGSLRTAIVRLEHGETALALRAASDACHDSPSSAEAHYVYGQAWLVAGEPARAEQAFAAALQLTPDWADAWVNYGVARYRQGAVDDAKTAMRQALRRSPEHPAATANLGAFLRITGESEGAEALLRHTLGQDPGNAGARLNLVADLLQEERASEALDLLDAAERPADADAARHWLLQRSLALIHLGRVAEARLALVDLDAMGPLPPAIWPLRHWRQVLLATAEGAPARAGAAAQAMETALDQMGPASVLEHRIMGHYDLAKFWSSHGEHARAFSHWTSGHRLLAPSQPFARDEHRAIIDANIRWFDRARFADGPRATNDDTAPVFIVGMPRSGTTLCEQILAAHADVHGAGERSALSDAVRALGGGPYSPDGIRRIASLATPELDAAAAAYLADLHGLAPGKARVLDKMPGNYLNLGLVGTMLPAARIIHCVRDPRDIGLSIFTFRFHGYHPYAHDIADIGWTIAQKARLMVHWEAVLPNPVLTVQLKDWVEDFDGTLRRALDFLDLPYDTACERFYERDTRIRTVSRRQVKQPVNASGLGRWRPYARELAPLIEELRSAGEILPDSDEAPAASQLLE